MRNFNHKQFVKIKLDHKQRQCGIYCIRNSLNDKIYIGSSGNCYHRIMSQHYWKLRSNQHSNPHLQSAWNEYGEDNFEAFVVEECMPDELILIEQLYLDNTNCLNSDLGYNINKFADRIVLTEEQKTKISLSKKGKKRSESTKKKLSEANKKRKWTEEQRQKFTVSTTGQKRTDETKNKMSISQKEAWKYRPRVWTDRVRELMMIARNRNREESE